MWSAIPVARLWMIVKWSEGKQGRSPVKHRGNFVRPSVRPSIPPSIHPSVCPPGPLRSKICPLRPEICPLSPWNLSSQALNLSGQMSCLRGLIQGLRGPILGPERADFRPERADFRSERAWGGQTEGWMDGETDGQTKVPLCSTGLCPLWGRCPKRGKILKKCLSRHGSTFTTQN